MASKLRDDVAYAISPFKLISCCIGVWPLQVNNIYSLTRYVLGFCCAVLMIIIPSIEIYLGCTDAETKVDCLMLVGCGILGVVKTVTFRIYTRNLANNYSSAIKDYLTIESTKERAIMRKHAFMGRTFCCLCLVFACFSCVMYGLIAILDENKQHVNITNEDIILEYPIPSKCIMNYFNAPMSMHKIFCVIDTVILLLASVANHGNDALFLNVTLHVCGQIKILKMNFNDFDKSPHIYDCFNILVNRHKYLIELARELAEMISYVLLIELFIISILLCIMGFQLILQLQQNDVTLIMKNIMVQSSFLMQLTLYCVIGNYLKSQMEEIGFSVYQNAWYNFPPKMIRHLVFIIMRSDTPVTLRAGNFIVVNLTTYVNILKTSLSYLSVLRVMVNV